MTFAPEAARPTSLENRSWIITTGLRRNEVTLVRIQDVDFDAGVIWLPPKVAKSKREQYVRLNSDLARRLRAYIKTLGDVDPESVLFPSTRKWGGKRAPKTAVPRSTTFDKDLGAASLAKKDARGRVLDMHALSPRTQGETVVEERADSYPVMQGTLP